MSFVACSFCLYWNYLYNRPLSYILLKLFYIVLYVIFYWNYFTIVLYLYFIVIFFKILLIFDWLCFYKLYIISICFTIILYHILYGNYLYKSSLSNILLTLLYKWYFICMSFTIILYLIFFCNFTIILWNYLTFVLYLIFYWNYLCSPLPFILLIFNNIIIIMIMILPWRYNNFHLQDSSTFSVYFLRICQIDVSFTRLFYLRFLYFKNQFDSLQLRELYRFHSPKICFHFRISFTTFIHHSFIQFCFTITNITLINCYVFAFHKFCVPYIKIVD